MKLSGPGSKHFSLHQIAENVYAAIATDGGAAICNAGLVDLGNQVVIFDTFLTSQAAQDLRQAAIELFSQTQHIVVNSHWHNDHIWGNQVFANQAWILSSSRTRQLIEANSQDEGDWFTANSVQKLASYRSQLQTASNDQRSDLIMMEGYYAGLVEAMPHFSLYLPNITFDQRLSLHGIKGTAELINFENGHTASDTVLYLPQEGVLFVSDLLFIGCHPFLGDGDPQGQQAALRMLRQMEAKCIVPGHGPVGKSDDLQRLIEYIDYCLEISQTLVGKDIRNEDNITRLELAESYESWRMGSFFQTNIRFLCKRLDPTADK
jgi:cyclase